MIRERIQNGEFESTCKYPSKETLANHEAYQKIAKELKRLQDGVDDLSIVEKDMRANMEIAYDANCAEIRANFRQTLEETYGLQNHPKKDQIWQKAWDDGHSGGYFEVLSAYDELAELVI